MKLRGTLFECCIAGTSDSTSDAFSKAVIQLKLPILAYTELANATNNFHPSKYIGRGTFSKVYHGVLQNGREIAIQRLCEDDFNRFQQYISQTVTSSLLTHKNLVSVYGCASNGKEILLVHEYISNGTLAYHLYGEGEKRTILSWYARLDIAIDTAKALAYLHSRSVIHCNMTPHSILLDSNFRAKVKGLLLSCELPIAVGSWYRVTHVILLTDRIRVRYRYMDQDRLKTGRHSVKSDVYSFGVVLFELLTSKSAMGWERVEISKIQNHAWDELFDPILGFKLDPDIKLMITAVAELAHQCLNDEEDLRPSMKQVLERLNGIRMRRGLNGIASEDLVQQNKGQFAGEGLVQRNKDLNHSVPKQANPIPKDDHCKKIRFQIFSKNVLAKATNDFHSNNYLGKGGFGTVYYGMLPDGREVAIKRFHEKKDKTIQQFMKETKILSFLRHQNLVSVYGRSSDQNDELLLVYEYVSNGPLASYLHKNSGNKLPWITRLNISIETARALAYLHDSGIIHRDVKPSNILLEENFGVKVADFGLARFLPLDASQGDPAFVSHVSTAPVGTPAYIDPEYNESSRVSDKSDVYSFGVVLFQLISSKPSSFTEGPQYFTLANFAMGKILNKALEEIVDPSLGFGSDNRIMETITAVAELAFQCVQCPKEIRPAMKQVLETLEGIKQGTWGFNQTT